MSFIGKTTEIKITTALGKTFKIFLTEQVGNYWVATILYAHNGNVTTHNEVANNREDAYMNAVTFVLNNIDKNAEIESLPAA
ncbi:hypothetical protein V3H24_14110 [Vibrio parahaemolyticus]|uniref:hypothetical protein n=1 Tax=Vibrio parahaemolyticus TaxID=670 RepID=UPI003B67A9D9